jgi:tRNA uridine 5-carbamoylmethylation protein Kti12
MPKHYILVGVPNSGKSTTVNALIKADENLHVFSTDAEIERMAAEDGKTYNDLIKTHDGIARKAANIKLKQALNLEKGIIFDQTNMGHKKRTKTLGDKIGSTQCICFLPPKDEAQFKTILDRNTQRVGKTIPVFVIIMMMKNFELPVKSDGYDSVVYYDINGRVHTEKQAKDHLVEFMRFVQKWKKED